jgi:hypothetical protein
MTEPATGAPAQSLEPLAEVSDPVLREGVRTLFRSAQEFIDGGAVQAVILAARRLACVYQVLVDAGEPPLRGAVVVSDRSRDMSLDPTLRGVLILDDSVVLGSTLHRLAGSVRERCPDAEVLVRSVVVDADQQVRYLLDSLDFAPVAERDADAVRTFSSELVHCLSRHQVPFFSDFPVAAPVRLDRAAWLRHLHLPDWHVADVTAPLLDQPDRQSLAHVPGDVVCDTLLRRLVPQVAELVDAFKVRSYTRIVGDDVQVVLVPIALLAPARTATVAAAVEALARAGGLEGLAWQQWDAETQQRFVQYAASACLLAEYRRLLDVHESVSEALAPVPFSLFFGVLEHPARAFLDALVQQFLSADPAAADAPLQLRVEVPTPSPLLREPRVRQLLFSTRELLEGVGGPPRPDTGQLTKIGLLFGHAIASVFGYIDETLETEQRQLIAALPDIAGYEAWRREGPGRVLSHGFTLAELTRSLVPSGVATDAWARSLVAFGLDIGNDLGIIVPVTQVDPTRDIVYRCYRLGETAFLANRPLPTSLARVEARPNSDGLQLHELLDAMAATAARGYPVHDAVVALEAAVPPQRLALPERQESSAVGDAGLAALVSAVRGTLVEGWNGVITDVSHDGFVVADLTPAHAGEPVLARLPIDWISSDERPQTRPGRRLVWSIWERERAGAKTRSSTLRLLPVPSVDMDAAGRRGAAVQALLRDDDDGA